MLRTKLSGIARPRAARPLGQALAILCCVALNASARSDAAGPLAPAPAVLQPPSPTRVLTQIAAQPDRGVSFRSDYDHRPRPGAERSLSPFLYVAGGDADTERLPLKETSADVSIAGVIARVRVHQVFANTRGQPIDAVYVFPASTRAAVHGMRMRVGERTVEAKIDRRAAARAAYEQARASGQRASLLEQERPNVFSMNVANLMPGDRIEVELDYSELLVPEDATYEFVYPAVVGPRYAGGADPAKDRWTATPHLTAAAAEPYRFDVRVHLETGIPIKDLGSPSHRIGVVYASPSSVDVSLDRRGDPIGNRDYVLRYRLAGDKIEAGLLLWEGRSAAGRDERFFTLMVEPPARPAAADVPGREYIFLLDVSGSMHGYPLETAKTLMRKLLSQLRPSDQFNLSLFSGAAYVMSPRGSIDATPENVARAIELVGRQTGGGSTELMGGLEASYRIPRRAAGISRTVVVVTDGYVGVEARAFRFIRERLGEANLFAFGIGSSVNRGLIEGMARAGQGEPFVVLGPQHAATEAEKLRELIERPLLTDVKVDFEGLEVEELASRAIPDLLADRPLVIFGKYRGAAEGRVRVTGTSGRGRVERVIEIGERHARRENAALQWLWARKWVELLEDEHHMGGGQVTEGAITALGLAYRLLTPFTSFVAVDSEVVNRGAPGKTVRQPLPMPDGVSNLAVGEEAEAVTVGRASGTMPKGKAAYGYGAVPGAGGLGGANVPSTPPPAPVTQASAPTKRLLAQAVKDEAPDAEPRRERRPAPAERSAEADKARDDRQGTARRGRAPVPAPSVIDGRASGLSGAVALEEAIRAFLARGVTSCAAPRAGEQVRLRFHVDGAGKVVRVDVLRGERATGACLAAAMHGLTSAAKARAGAVATLEATIAWP